MSMEIGRPQVVTLPIVSVFCKIFGISVMKGISAVVRGAWILTSTCTSMAIFVSF